MTINNHNHVTDPAREILEVLDSAKKEIDSDWAKMRAELASAIASKRLNETSEALMKAVVRMQVLTQNNLPDLRLANLAGAIRQAWVTKEIHAAGGIEAFEAGLNRSSEVH